MLHFRKILLLPPSLPALLIARSLSHPQHSTFARFARRKEEEEKEEEEKEEEEEEEEEEEGK
jgi:ribosomal protein L12E/L44/L45/RPP1/RPP2